MSAYHAIQAIENEAHDPNEGARAFHLEIELRSGRKVVCALVKANSYTLKVNEIIEDKRDVVVKTYEQTTYLAYEAIDQVTPIWL